MVHTEQTLKVDGCWSQNVFFYTKVSIVGWYCFKSRQQCVDPGLRTLRTRLLPLCFIATVCLKYRDRAGEAILAKDAMLSATQRPTAWVPQTTATSQ